MSKIYISSEKDPYYNVALEHELFMASDKQTSLYLWQNDKTVVCGRNQNVYAECDFEFLKENAISPVRRFSGGGTVYQDLGNLNFTFINKEECANMDKYLRVIKKAMEIFGIKCEFSGRNDLLYDGKKFSGHAYYADEGNYMYHGTLMVDVDMDMLAKALKPSYIKMKSKGIDSVRSRVVNLKSICEEISIEAVIDAMSQAFEDVFQVECDKVLLSKKSHMPQMYEVINQEQWIFGEAPHFSLNMERKLPLGNVSVSVEVVDGKIEQLMIRTDSLIVYDFNSCISSLIGKFFDEDSIFREIEEFMNQNEK